MSDAHREEIIKLESLYAQNPEGRIFTHLAEAYRKAGELERAREVLTGGIERHPDYSSAHVVLGRVLVDLGQHDEARAEFRRVLELDGQNLVALRSLGDIARDEGREDEALTYYQRLLDQEPSDDDVREIIDAMTGVGSTPEEEALAGDAEALMAEEETPVAEEPVEEEWASAASADLDGMPDLETDAETDGEPGWTHADEESGEERPSWGPPAHDGHEEPVEEPLYEPAADAVPEESLSIDGPGYEDAEEEADDAPEDGAPYAPSGFGMDAEDETEAEEPAAPWEPEAGQEAPEADEETDETEPWAVAGDLDDAWSTGSDDEDVGYEVGDEADTGWPFQEPDEVETEPEPGEPDDADVMTETIAQVYARQGLYDRAVEVYQGLIRARPDDEGLRERLAEIEAQAAAEREAATEDAGAAGEAEGAVDDAETAEVEDAGDAEAPETWAGEYGREAEDWDSGLEFEPDFLGVQDEEEEADAAEGEPPQDEEAHPEGFEAVEFSAEPSEGVASLEGLESREVEPDTGLVRTPDEEAAGEVEPAADGPEEPEEPESWDIPEEALDEVLAEADEATAGAEEALEGVETAAHESPWMEEEWSGDEEAETPYAWGETGDATEDDSPPIHDYLQGLLRWGGGPATPAGSGARPDGGARPGGTADPQAPEPGGGTEGDDDDDLEMFRSWLESLKE